MANSMKLLITIGVVVFFLQLLSNSFAIIDEPIRGTVQSDDFFTNFVNEAHLYDANYNKNFTSNIPWADKNLMAISADFHRRNYIGLSIMQMNSFIEVLAIRSISSVVLTTRSFDDVPKAYDRMLKTFVYIRLMCLSGPQILDPESDGGKTIKLIRQRHRSAAYLSENRSLEAIDALKDNSIREFSMKQDIVPDNETRELVLALRADLAIIDTSESPKHLENWDWSKPVGQFDLAVGQFLFYGHVVFSPRVFGVYSATEKEIQAYMHFWAVVGRMLGMEDRFNLALNLPFSDHGRFYRNIIVASFKNADERTVRLMGNMMEGMYRDFIVPTATRFKCWLFYFLRDSLPEFEGRNILRLMDLEDMVCLHLVGILSGPLNLSFFARSLSTLTFDSWLRQEMERLGIKYEF